MKAGMIKQAMQQTIAFVGITDK
ncbi:lipid-A-disaccharide synthase [Rickettsia akari str. Hartford]|uniref:Lipid-A-disaccharide synthase n=1 Tax=Rickettsia akari (strain Hartford) TaxID=293614 RepID=A8GN01_RICAH|nr:lipid-A-disaccharide synthase [Rickettsia akari str. Hartford]